MHPRQADIDLYVCMTIYIYILIRVCRPTYKFVHIYIQNYHLQATPVSASYKKYRNIIYKVWHDIMTL